MSRRLNHLAERIDNEERALWLLIPSGLFILIGGFYQSGHTLVAWHVFGWLPLIGLAGVITALVFMATQLESWSLLLTAAGVWFLALFGPGSNRFPGMQLEWLWLVVAFVATLLFLVTLGDGLEIDEYVPEHPASRLAVVVLLGGAAMTIGLVALYHTWAMVENVVITDAVLAVFYMLLERGAPSSLEYQMASLR
jgi:hypothetical protein